MVLAAVRATAAIADKIRCALWNHFRVCPVSPWADGGTIAMRIEYLAAIAIAAFVAGAGLAVHSVGSLPPEKQSTPAAAQLATLLAESVDPFLLRSGG
jgi:hypothetical protein